MHFTNCGVRLTARINIVRVLYTWRTYLCSHDGHVFSHVNMCLAVFNWQPCHSSWLARVVKTRKGIVAERKKKGKIATNSAKSLGRRSNCRATFGADCSGRPETPGRRQIAVKPRFFLSTFFYGISWYSRWSHYAFSADNRHGRVSASLSFVASGRSMTSCRVVWEKNNSVIRTN